MSIKTILCWAVVWSMGTLAMGQPQSPSTKTVLRVDNENVDLNQYKASYQAALQAEEEKNKAAKEEFDLDAYINSIDWEKEEESILKWYSALPEDKNKEEDK